MGKHRGGNRWAHHGVHALPDFQCGQDARAPLSLAAFPSKIQNPTFKILFLIRPSACQSVSKELPHESMKAMAELTKDCLELPSAQRLKLARILLDTSESDQDFSPGVEAAWNEEIAARLKAVLNGTAKSSPLAEVLARFEKLYPA
jgi:hypothetical protein